MSLVHGCRREGNKVELDILENRGKKEKEKKKKKKAGEGYRDTELKFRFEAYVSKSNWLVDTCRSRSSVGCEKMTEVSFLIASLHYLATT